MEQAYKILIVAHSSGGQFSPYVGELAEGLRSYGMCVETYGIEKRGLLGYLGCLRPLKQKLRSFEPDFVHACYGLSGLLANLQRKYPVVTTYLGSDIHSGGWLLKLSRLCIRLSRFNIFVSSGLLKIAMRSTFLTGRSLSYAVIPGGVDMNVFYPVDRAEAREMLMQSLKKSTIAHYEGVFDGRFEEGKKYVLFAGSFTNGIKNYPDASKAIKLLDTRISLIQMRGYTRQQVNLLLNSVDCLLMTSFREGSPMVIKEAMAVGCPVVSVDVGDVRDLISDVCGCYMADRNSEDIAGKLSVVIKESEIRTFEAEPQGRRILLNKGLDAKATVARILRIYENL